MKGVIPHMRARQAGSIINVPSIWGMSIVESCRRLKVPVREYLSYVLPGLDCRTLSHYRIYSCALVRGSPIVPTLGSSYASSDGPQAPVRASAVVAEGGR
jgi:hypothetical protein